MSKKYCTCKEPMVAEGDKPTFHHCYKCHRITTEKQREKYREADDIIAYDYAIKKLGYDI